MLLQYGDYNIHSTPCEQLVEDTDAAEAAQLQAVMGVLSTSYPSSASDSSAQTSDMGPILASDSLGTSRIKSQHADAQGTRALPSSAGLDNLDGMEVDAPAPSVAELAASEVTQEAAVAAAAEHAMPADPDEDIFGAADAQPRQTGNPDGPVQHTPSHHQQSASVVHSSVSDSQSQQDGKPHDQATLVNPTAAMQGADSGFVYDESSGTWYSTAHKSRSARVPLLRNASL